MYHVIRNFERVPVDVVDRYAKIGVATVHEAQGRKGAMAAAIKPAYPGARVLGTALTVKCHPGDNLMLHKALDIVREGEVIVCSVDGWEGGPWGEMMSVIAMARGCAGLVIDGYVRDGDRIRELGFPVFARGLSVKGTMKDAIGLINHPISCGDVIVQPGDLVIGDTDGVCVVPGREAETILQKSRERDASEDEMRPALAAGKTLWRLSGFDAVAAARGLTEEPLSSAAGAAVEDGRR